MKNFTIVAWVLIDVTLNAQNAKVSATKILDMKDLIHQMLTGTKNITSSVLKKPKPLSALKQKAKLENIKLVIKLSPKIVQQLVREKVELIFIWKSVQVVICVLPKLFLVWSIQPKNIILFLIRYLMNGCVSHIGIIIIGKCQLLILRKKKWNYATFIVDIYHIRMSILSALKELGMMESMSLTASIRKGILMFLILLFVVIQLGLWDLISGVLLILAKLW